MRKLLILILFCVSIGAAGQTTLHLVFQPCDLGTGLRVDQQIKNVGFYVLGSKGEYRFEDGYIRDHVKFSAGLLGYVKEWQSFFSIGVNRNSYGEYRLPGDIPKNTLSRYSCDIGVGVRMSRVSVIVSFDPIKFEGTTGIGIIIR